LIEVLAAKVKKDVYHFPRPLINSYDYDFSFSGLKTAVLREIQKDEKMNDERIANICYSLQEAVFDLLLKKTFRAASEFRVKSILLGGGVTANQTLRKRFEEEIENRKSDIKLFIPDKKLCTDNAAMIAAASFFINEKVGWQKVSADPELYFD
jgi:N6-L-threonylcarbamoyladenine synthase